MSLNHFPCTAAVVILTAVAGASSVYGQTSFNETFNVAPSSACAPGGGNTGCTNFTSVLGGVSFSFVFASSGDGGTMIWEGQYGDGNSPSMNCQSNSFNLATVETVSIKRTDNQLFNFTSIFIDNAGGNGVAISTYRGGSSVGTTEFVSVGTASTYNFAGILVDEVRITGSDLVNTNIDSFKGAIPASNNAPVMVLSGGAASATEQIPAIIDNQLTISDSDSAALVSATVSVSANYQSGQDVLGFTNNGSTMGNITASFNPGAGVLNLISTGGTATVGQWQAALRSVSYTNTSDAPVTANRTISFVANDGAAASAAANKLLAVTAVNDAPVLTVPGNVNVTRGQATAITGISIADADAGSGSSTLALSASSGVFSATSGGGVTVSGSGTSTVNLSGTVANLNAFVAGSNVSYTSAVEPPAGLTLLVSTNDNGNIGSGGAQTDSETVSITVVPPSSVDEWDSYEL